MPSPSDIASLAQACREALARQDWPVAETLLRRGLEAAPENPEFLHNLGLAAFHKGDFAEAETHLRKAVALNPDAQTGGQTAVLLGRTYEAAGRGTEALHCYKAVLRADPAQFDALMGVAGIRERMGDDRGASACYRQAAAVRPTDVTAGLKYALTVWDDSPRLAAEATQRLLASCGDNLQLRAEILDTAAWQMELSQRIDNGFMPYHATRLEELFFTYAVGQIEDIATTNAALLDGAPGNGAAKVRLGFARFCRGDRHGAEALFQSAHDVTTGYILDAVRFSSAFHDDLRRFSKDDLAKGLPPRITVMPMVPDPSGVLFLACDFAYFASFGFPMLHSLRENTPGTPVHLHIMDATPDDIARIIDFCANLTPLRVALSAENPGLTAAPKMQARSYYHAVRLIRFYETLQQYSCPMWMADVDALVNRNLAGLFAKLGKNDVAMRIRPGRLEPQHQFSACLLGAAATAASHAYFRQVAAYIAHFYQRDALRWGIDQLALYSVFADLQDRHAAPVLKLLGDRDVDLDCSEGGFVWVVAGARKFNHLKRAKGPASSSSTDARGDRFVAALQKHKSAAQAIMGRRD